MLKEYTLKVTVRVGGGGSEDEEIQRMIDGLEAVWGATCEITHEEVVDVDEVERE